MLTLTIDRIRFNGVLEFPPTVSLYIKEYYGDTYTLIASGVNIDENGYVTDSPLPATVIDPTIKYVLKAVNEWCSFEYEQSIILYPYCPINYELAPDNSYCFLEEIIPATPPSGTPNTLVQKTDTSYSACGSYIYSPGYNVNGTGTSAQISTANTFWCNGGTCVDNTLVDGPLNRCGLWSSVVSSNQDIGFGVCIEITETKTYYVAIACDNYGIIKLDGVTIVQQNVAALAAQYPLAGLLVTFRIFHIYPVELTAGSHILEMFGHNDSGTAALGCEIYNNTSAEIAAATSYSGLNLVFSSKDYFGQQVQIGSGGYTCPSGYSLKTCESPFVCSRILTTPVLF